MRETLKTFRKKSASTIFIFAMQSLSLFELNLSRGARMRASLTRSRAASPAANECEDLCPEGRLSRLGCSVQLFVQSAAAEQANRPCRFTCDQLCWPE